MAGMMIEDTLAVSVIIPTHNRSALLGQVLDALGLQTYPLSQIEVVVVADGCTDGTIEFLQHYETPFTLQVYHQHPIAVASLHIRITTIFLRKGGNYGYSSS